MNIGRQNIWAVVPVKSFAGAKQRLGGLLAPEERQTLSRLMLEDVLSALERTPSLAGIAVVTADRDAAGIALAAGARVIRERRDTGITAAVTRAAERMDATGCDGILVVPADVPSITPTDVGRVIAAHSSSPAVTLVAASDGGGTNALACSPPRLIPFAYGEESFRRHWEAARSRGVTPAVLEIERIGRDIDRPGDVAAFVVRPSATRAYRYLDALRVADRLRENAPDRVRRPAQSVY